MSKDKKIRVYVENHGRGKAAILDSRISVNEYPSKNDGKPAIGLNATPAEISESFLDTFEALAAKLYPNQLNVLTEEEFEALKGGDEEEEKEDEDEGQDDDPGDQSEKGDEEPIADDSGKSEVEPTEEKPPVKPDYDALESETGEKQDDAGPSPEEKMENEFFRDAITGDEDQILAYMEHYPEGKYINQVEERSDFLDAKKKGTKKSLREFLKRYPQGQFAKEADSILKAK